MAEPFNPLVQDPRVIPIPISLAICLSYLPGVDDREVKDREGKTKPRTGHLRRNADGEVVGIKESDRGIQRAMVLVELNHKLLTAARTDIRLAVVDGVRWYARSYKDWHHQDLQCIPSATLKKIFQALIASGLIIARSDRALVATDPQWSPHARFLQLLSVYNLKAFTIDYDVLTRLMAFNARVQAYLESFKERQAVADLAPTEGSDRIDPGIGSIPGVGSDRSRGSDRIDPGVGSDRSRGRIGSIPGSDRIDPRSASTDQYQDQQRPPSSAAAAEQTPLTGAEENRRATLEAPSAPAGAAPEPLYLKLNNDERITYAKLTAHHVDSAQAVDIVQRCASKQIDAWLDYVRRASISGSELKPVRNPGGFLVKMLEHPENYPRPETKPVEKDGRRFLSGPMGDEINH